MRFANDFVERDNPLHQRDSVSLFSSFSYAHPALTLSLNRAAALRHLLQVLLRSFSIFFLAFLVEDKFSSFACRYHLSMGILD